MTPFDGVPAATSLPMRRLGRTNIDVSILGLGGGPLGSYSILHADAERLVHTALDLGINLFDTAPSYGSSEERIGRALRGRREEAIVVTKGGYGVPGIPDWTKASVERGIDLALRRLGTDYIDVFLLHSCPPATLRGALVEPLVRAREAGKVRAIGYSGDGEALLWAALDDRLDVVECSFNLYDQGALSPALRAANLHDKGTIGKRALAGAPWDGTRGFEAYDRLTYRERMSAMALPAFGLDPAEAALRFAAYAPDLATTLVGTRDVSHLCSAAAAVMRGPLPDSSLRAIATAYDRVGANWQPVV